MSFDIESRADAWFIGALIVCITALVVMTVVGVVALAITRPYKTAVLGACVGFIVVVPYVVGRAYDSGGERVRDWLDW